MDLTHPYAADQSRLRLLYRLPVDQAPSRVLIVGVDPAALAQFWGDAEVRHVASLSELRPGQRFDVVAVPDLLGPGRTDARAQLEAAVAALQPGGTLVGHMDHGLSLRHSASWRGLRRLLLASVDRRRPHRHGRVSRLLRGAGLAEVECFYVTPSINAPMALIPCAPTAARAHFARALESSRESMAWYAYLVRRLLLVTRSGQMLRDELFFWAVRPC